MNPQDGQFVSTGVAGLDDVLIGGFLRGGFYLIQGDPGSGKTTIALQYVFDREMAGEKCLYVTLTESRRDLENACRSHGWDLGDLEICDLSQSAAYLSGEPETSVFHPSETALGETTQAIFAAVSHSRPQHVVFDGLSEMRLLSGDALTYRRQLLALKDFFLRHNATVMLLDDRSTSFGQIQPESLVGGNVILERIHPEYGRARRRMFVTKVRGSSFRDGYHDYDIVQGGVVVYPRLVASEHHDVFQRTNLPCGVKNLDLMLQGGLATGSTTLLIGPAGAGKSTVAMQFLVSAIKSGQKVAAYIFDEVFGTLVERTEKLCVGHEGGVREYLRTGMMHAQQIDPAELSPGAFAHEVRRAVDDGARVILIDSLNGYLNAMPQERFLTTHLHELFAYLSQKGVITIVVVAQHGMIIGTGSGEVDVSYLADTVLLFRYFEAQGEVLQALGVFKKRCGPHERTIRQLQISEKGIEVGEPLREFRGILTGVPEYDGETQMLPMGAKQ